MGTLNKKIGLAAIALALVVAAVAPVASAAAPVTQPLLPMDPGMWIAVAGIAVLMVIAVAAMVYMLSGPLDSPNARGWARAQIYEGVLTMALIAIFLFFAWLLLLNPQGAFRSINVLPGPGAFNCGGVTDMSQLATCNIAVFNAFSYGLFQSLFMVTVYLGYAPGFSLSVQLGKGNAQFQGTASVPSIIPFDAEASLSFAFSGFILFFLLNQIQVLLLSTSLFWLAFFVSLGLIVRAFGVTRSFGGALIAIGLGLGLIYPLITNLTYGFINTQLANSPDPASISLLLFDSVFSIAFGNGLPGNGWVYPLSVAIAGLTFIPFLNFTILDAFIVDFSKAVGERLDFMSIMVNII